MYIAYILTCLLWSVYALKWQIFFDSKLHEKLIMFTINFIFMPISVLIAIINFKKHIEKIKEKKDETKIYKAD